MAASLPYPALYATHGGIWMAHADGVEALGRGEAIARAAETPLIMLNAPLVGQRLGYPELSGLDISNSSHSFTRAVRGTDPKGMAHALGLEAPESDSEAAAFLRLAAETLLQRLEQRLAGAGRRLGFGAVALPAALALVAGSGGPAAAAGAGRTLAFLEAAGMGGKWRARPA
jgi:hypothetical protein